MDLGSILVILALILVVGAIIARPLFEDRGRDMGSREQKRSILLAEEEKVLATLQELDLDHAMGKVLSGDYQAQRAALVAQGAAVLKAIDEAELTGSLGRTEAARPMTGEARPAAAQPRSEQDEIEAEIARRRRVKGSQSGTCGQCGKPVVPGDQFCSHCGSPLAAGASPR